MKLTHVALWARDIEKLKTFYITYFDAKPNTLYTNKKKAFNSYFLSFESEVRLEIMEMPEIIEPNLSRYGQAYRYCHIAFSVGHKSNVMALTNQLREDGYEVISEPRTTGDGYFESVVLDPENNRIEITL